MFFKSSGALTEAGVARSFRTAWRSFASSQHGAVTVDFVPLVCAVIGLGVAVVSLLGATLSSPTAQVANVLENITVEEPNLGLAPSNGGVFGGLPKVAETPVVDTPPPSSNGASTDSPTVVGSAPATGSTTGSGAASSGGGVKTVGLVGIVSVTGPVGGASSDNAQNSGDELFSGDGQPTQAQEEDGEGDAENSDLFDASTRPVGAQTNAQSAG